MEWISKRNISIIPAPINLECFKPGWYSADESRKIIQKGFNPKMELYRFDDQRRANLISDLTNRLGQDFTKLEDNFWFCIKKSECGQTCSTRCKDQISKFIYGKGNRTKKNIKLGQGGFGQVFLGKIHGMEIGAKYIDVTDKFKQLTAGLMYEPSNVIPALLGDVAFEATLQSNFGNQNILEARDFWIQCSGLDVVNPINDRPIIELVIATEKCFKNLQEWCDTEPFNYGQIGIC